MQQQQLPTDPDQGTDSDHSDGKQVADTSTTAFELRQVVDLEGHVQCSHMDTRNMIVVVPEQLPQDFHRLRSVSQSCMLQSRVNVCVKIM